MQSAFCEGNFKAEEVKLVLQKAANNKSPRSDGSTIEFYILFQHFLTRGFNHSSLSGKLSITQRQGVIAFIPKGNEPREYLKNWRLITLLNTDYTLLAGVLASRMEPVLSNAISEDQRGFLRNTCISENCRLIYDVMLEMEKKMKPVMPLLVTLKKTLTSLVVITLF